MCRTIEWRQSEADTTRRRPEVNAGGECRAQAKSRHSVPRGGSRLRTAQGYYIAHKYLDDGNPSLAEYAQFYSRFFRPQGVLVHQGAGVALP